MKEFFFKAIRPLKYYIGSQIGKFKKRRIALYYLYFQFQKKNSMPENKNSLLHCIIKAESTFMPFLCLLYKYFHILILYS